MLAILAVDVLDSFQIPSSADERGRALTGRLLGEVADLGRRDGQDAIAVALITEGTLNGWETGPPPPYRRQGDLILRLAAAEPRAIFLDFLYSFPREDEAARAYLGQAIDAARSKGVPVFLGPVTERPEFAPLSRAAQVDLGFRHAAADEYPMQGATGRPTAAAALYQEHCRDPAASCDPAFLRAAAAGEAPALALQWRPRSPASLALFWPPQEVAGCSFATDAWADRIAATARVIALEATRGLRAESDLSRTACFPHLAAPAGLLMSEQVDDALLAEFARGRIVMIGSAYQGSADEALAPGYGRIPGVFQHAMALDNLITFGADYRRQPPEAIYALGWDDLLEAVISILLLSLGSWAIHGIVRGAPRPGEDALSGEAWRARVVAPAAAFYGFAAAALTAPFAAGYVVSTVFLWSPGNAVGVVLAVIGVGALVLPRGAIAGLRDAGVLWPLIWGLLAMIGLALVGGVAIGAFLPDAEFVMMSAFAALIALLGVAAGAGVVALMRPRVSSPIEGAS